MPLQPLFVLQFDRILAGSSVARANYAIVSGTSKDLVFKQVRVDPVERAVIFALDTPLLPSVQYDLVIKAADREADRLAAYDGAAFQGPYTIHFSTGTDAKAEIDVDAAVDPCAALNVLQGSCLGSQCHGESKPTGASPAMGLSFVSNAAVQGTAVGHGATLVQNAASPRAGSTAPPFPYGMKIISPGDSSGSFLLYKILLDSQLRDDLTVGVDDPFPMTTIAQAPATPRRLTKVAAELSHVVPGESMPPADLGSEPKVQPYAPLSLESVRLLRAWIDQGAPACGSASDAGTDAVTDGSTDASTDGATEASMDAASDAAEGG